MKTLTGIFKGTVLTVASFLFGAFCALIAYRERKPKEYPTEIDWRGV